MNRHALHSEFLSESEAHSAESLSDAYAAQADANLDQSLYINIYIYI